MAVATVPPPETTTFTAAPATPNPLEFTT
jgi:hypothetical protein